MNDWQFQDKVLQELKDIKERIGKLERSTTPIQPIQPVMPTIPPTQWNKSCSKCGLKFDGGAIGYVCNNHPCPSGLGGVWCATNELE